MFGFPPIKVAVVKYAHIEKLSFHGSEIEPQEGK